MQHYISEEIHRLWDELCDIGLNEIDTALNHCMRRLCAMIGARNAFWVAIVRMVDKVDAQPDMTFGWRIRWVQLMDQANQDTTRVPDSTPINAVPDPGATNVALAASTGRFRSYRLQAGVLVDVDAFRTTPHYQTFYTTPGVRDRLWVAFPISADTESVFCFDRFIDQDDFNDADLEVVSYALRGIKWFHRQLLLSRGLGIALAPLTDAERRVNKFLLAGASEKEIALQLSLSAGTVHQYATRIYRKYGVKGRAEFMSLWLAGKY